MGIPKNPTTKSFTIPGFPSNSSLSDVYVLHLFRRLRSSTIPLIVPRAIGLLSFVVVVLVAFLYQNYNYSKAFSYLQNIHYNPFFNMLESSNVTVLNAVEKSPNDERDYRLLTLANELDVLLIHDPTTDKSAAALDCNVGHLSDPEVAPGLAHFCEHMLFLGTEKYPVENEYSKFLSAHGGHSNAFTGTDNTNYYFEVDAGSLEGALDRFAQFFIAPLFAPSCTDREMNAVDSENKKNLQQDSWRLYQLEKNLSSPTHPFCKFGTGNLETLRDWPLQKELDIRQILLDFHAKYYSANVMKLVVVGKESLDTLQEWVVSKFSAVKNNSVSVPTYPGHALTEAELGKQISVVPVKDLRILELCFPFPDSKPHFRSKPTRYITHLIGHEGEGSILALLKNKAWANGLSAGCSRGGNGFEFFKISVDLTEEGLVHYKQVITTIFQYIQLLKTTGPQEWIFEEVKSLADMSFRFKEKSTPAPYASRVAGNMHHYPKDLILSGPYRVWEYDAKTISELIDLLDVDKFRVTLVSKDLKPDGEWLKEKWYGTEYQVRDLDADLKAQLKNLQIPKDLHLPVPNDFMPENFTVRKFDDMDASKKRLAPRLVENSGLLRLWFKKDDTFYVPKAHVYIMLKSPLAYISPRHSVLTQLYCSVLRDSLVEFSYYAEVAGLNYSLENTSEGLTLIVSGYNDKISRLLQTITERMVSLAVKPDRFKVLKEQMSRSLKNFEQEAPYQHSVYWFSYLTQEKLWSHAEKLDVLEAITPQDVAEFFPLLLSDLHIETLVHGNMEESDAVAMGNLVKDILKPKALMDYHQTVGTRTVLLSEGDAFFYERVVPNKDNLNSAIEYYLQLGDVRNNTLRVIASLFAQIAHEPCFDTLRTKEQLGYLVFSGIRRQAGVFGFRVIVQSERDSAYLESRIESFLSTTLEKVLADMNEQEFSKHVSSLRSKLLEKHKNLAAESNRYYSHVHSKYCDFAQERNDAELLLSITKEQVVEFFKTHVHPSSQCRKKISIHNRSQAATKSFDDAELEARQWLENGNERVTDVMSWKAQRQLSSAAVPILPWEEYSR